MLAYLPLSLVPFNKERLDRGIQTTENPTKASYTSSVLVKGVLVLLCGLDEHSETTVYTLNSISFPSKYNSAIPQASNWVNPATTGQ